MLCFAGTYFFYIFPFSFFLFLLQLKLMLFMVFDHLFVVADGDVEFGIFVFEIERLVPKVDGDFFGVELELGKK